MIKFIKKRSYRKSDDEAKILSILLLNFLNLEELDLDLP